MPHLIWNRIRKDFLLAAVLTLCVCIVTTSLGVWQLKRLVWKDELLSRISHAAAMAPQPLESCLAPYTKVIVTGRFLNKAVRYGTSVRQSNGQMQLGSDILVPLKMGENNDLILIDRGWVPENWQEEVPSGNQSITGYLRPSDHSMLFGVQNDLKKSWFFSLDIDLITRQLGLLNVKPCVLVELKPYGHVLPFAAIDFPRPTNNHFNYAITWFGLSIVFLGGFIFFLYSKR